MADDEIIRAVRDFLDSLTCTPNDELCALCGTLKKFAWSTFYYDGDSWDIALPFCDCQALRNS